LVLVECSFLIPTVRDSDRLPHPGILWRRLRDELIRIFGGVQGPRHRLVLSPEFVEGGWMPARELAPVFDECREFRVALEEERLNELRRFLGRVALSFDQREIYLSVRAFVESIRPGDEFL
jgi:hypothetical protein